MNTDKQVSRRHCMIARRGIAWYVADLESTNGTYVNGERITGDARLANNDTISLGRKAAAYQFRMRIVNLGKWISIVRTPKVLVPSVILLAALIFIPVFALLFAGPARVDTKKGLERMRETYGEDVIPTDPDFLAALDSTVKRLANEPGYETTLARRSLYKDSIERILSGYNLEPDFSFIPWVESGYDANAYNARSRAAGMWQFIPDTARHYGLRVDGTVDERYDPVKSAYAAASCLRDLVSIFGNDSFLLVLASYNAGEYGVYNALRQIEDPVADRNYWYLSKHDLIPEETKRYVMAILALIVIADSR